MNVAVYGLWHLGCVTAAGLASVGHHVIGLDADTLVVNALARGQSPIAEPGLEDCLRSGLSKGLLTFSSHLAIASKADVLWVTFDTPVDEDDRADVGFVEQQIVNILPFLEAGTIVLVSSQMPVGTMTRLERIATGMGRELQFACSPENLRLGKALDIFLHPDRIVIGARSKHARSVLSQMLEPITDRLVWMSPESAEMSKHAINSFLALSVAYANELAVLCEVTGADAKDVERALKSEQRIGPGAYLSPGPAFAGGTLARDIAFLADIGSRARLTLPVISAVKPSNDHHKLWIHRQIESRLASQTGPRVIAVWGLTYKPGTDTLRRSSAVELCHYLNRQGYVVRVHDPAFRARPDALAVEVTFCVDPILACQGADVLVIATPWPVYRLIDADTVAQVMRENATVIDAARFLHGTMGQCQTLDYVAIGRK